MKRALTVLLFLSFTIGVFVDGYEVSVTEGDSVTLKSGVTEIQTDDEIVWRFNRTRIAKISRGNSGISVEVEPDGSFRDRLQLDSQTGDLKISNIRITDSGEYKLQISSPSGSSEIIFTVKVVPAVVSAAEVESVFGLEGYSVTLHTDLTEIQGDYVIQWRFKQQKSPVFEINRKAGIVNTVDTDERFRARLKLDQTGSLTIKNTRTTDSGLYEVYISRSRSRHTIHHTQSFSLTVRDDVKSVFVLEGDDVTLRTGLTDTKTDDQIVWKFGDDEVIADLNGPANQDNFGLNKQTGVLTIRNIQTDQSGLYKVEIKTRTMTSHRKYQITVVAVPGPRLSPDVPESGLSSAVPGPRLSSDGPDPGLSPAAVAGIGGFCFLLGAAVGAAAAGVIYYFYKKSKDKIYDEMNELRKNQTQLSVLYEQLNSKVINVPEHPPSMDNMDMDSKDNQMQNQPLKGQLADDTENVSMKNLCGSQSAESDTENSPFREIKGNKEHGYEIL